MQPNFAFEPAPALDSLPGPKPTECRAPKVNPRERNELAATRDDDSYPSFKSSLREARKSQEEASRPENEKAGREVNDETPRDCRKTENDHGPVHPDAGDDQKNEREKSDHGSGEKLDELLEHLLALETGIEEHPVHELAGANPVAQFIENQETAAGAGLNPESSMGTGAGGAGSLDIAGDMTISNSGNDAPVNRSGIPGLNDPTMASGTEKSPGGNPVANTDATGIQKGESIESFRQAAASDSNTAQSQKSFEDLVQSEARSAGAEKVKIAGKPDAGAGAAPKNIDGPPGDQPQPLKPSGTGPGASGQKSSNAGAQSPEEVPVARSGEVSSDQQGSARIRGDLQHNREFDGRLDPVNGEEAGPKLVKVNAGSKDTAFMHQQDQNFDRLMEPTFSAREKEGAAGAWRARTLDQIVSRAVYQLKNGQNSVRIDLKPEFLGQVRMQIVTIDQQVSVRITTELPMVKEMLDNNLQQLKADLQQQGLEVDEIEVSVSADSQHNARNRRMQFEELTAAEAEVGDENQADDARNPEIIPTRRVSDRAVDMFA
jgi:flagellar hook-length control protein FliK